MNAQDGRTVLVALDGSLEATRALPLARAVAAQLHARLVVIHAAREAADVADVSSLVALDGADLDGLSVEVRAGSPSTVIVEQLERPGVELLVLTTVAAGDPDRDLGSVALNVTINTTRPILWLRPEAGLEKSETAPPISRLLVPLDGTHATAWALKPVTALAARLGASVDVLYVVSAAGGGDADLPAPRYVDQQQHEWRNWSREVRERLMVECAGCAPGAEIAVQIREGDPGAEIVRFAGEGHYDAIVLVRRSRLEPERAPTLRTVIRTSPCPVFVVGGEA